MTYKVVYIITGLSVGGAERMLLKLLMRLDQTRYSISVISLTDKGVIGKQIENLGIPVLSLELNKSLTSIKKILFLIKHLRLLRPHLVHTWLYHADLFGGLAARLSGVSRVIWSIRQSNLSPELNSKSTLKIIKLCSWLSSILPQVILCNSKLALLNHKEIGYKSDRMRVIYNGFDLNEYNLNKPIAYSLQRELGLSDGVLLVGMVARFDSQKNHNGFFQAAGKIHATQPDIHFVLIGNEVDINNSMLVGFIRENNIGNVVHLLGQRSDVSNLMSSISVLVSPSHGESFPNVLGEAMASGVPCVATDVGDCAEIIGDTGLVVDPGDMDALANSVLSLLSMDAIERKSLGERARKRIQKHYDIDHIVEEYNCFYKNIIEGIN